MGQTETPVSTLVVGSTVVTPRPVLDGVGPFTQLVVIGVHDDGTVDLARLGGDEGRSWPRVATGGLVEIAV